MSKWGSAASWWRATRHPLRAAFGHLEREVMQILWTGEELAVRDVRCRLDRTVAYTTVMTTLDRLYKKGFVTRRRQARAFFYTAAIGRQEIETRVTSGLVSDLLAGGDATPLLSNLVDVVADRDDRLLDELERLVKDKRARIKRGEL